MKSFCLYGGMLDKRHTYLQPLSFSFWVDGCLSLAHRGLQLQLFFRGSHWSGCSSDHGVMSGSEDFVCRLSSVRQPETIDSVLGLFGFILTESGFARRIWSHLHWLLSLFRIKQYINSKPLKPVCWNTIIASRFASNESGGRDEWSIVIVYLVKPVIWVLFFGVTDTFTIFYCFSWLFLSLGSWCCSSWFSGQKSNWSVNFLTNKRFKVYVGST